MPLVRPRTASANPSRLLLPPRCPPTASLSAASARPGAFGAHANRDNPTGLHSIATAIPPDSGPPALAEAFPRHRPSPCPPRKPSPGTWLDCAASCLPDAARGTRPVAPSTDRLVEPAGAAADPDRCLGCGGAEAPGDAPTKPPHPVSRVPAHPESWLTNHSPKPELNRRVGGGVYDGVAAFRPERVLAAAVPWTAPAACALGAMPRTE
eukprot:scaffold1678_cov110-Isochrysis_galbana.AAC.7